MLSERTLPTDEVKHTAVLPGTYLEPTWNLLVCTCSLGLTTNYNHHLPVIMLLRDKEQSKQTRGEPYGVVFSVLTI